MNKKNYISAIASLAIAATPFSVEAQRFNAAPRLIKLGDTIRTQREENARRLCHSWGGTYLIARPDERNAWDCFAIGTSVRRF